MPESPSPQEQAARNFELLHKFIGTEVVAQLVTASDEDRLLAGKETYEYLSACDDAELSEAARKLEHLYSAAAVVNPRVNVRTVDIFAQAFMRVVKTEDDGPGLTVRMARYRSQNRAKEPLPFTYDEEA